MFAVYRIYADANAPAIVSLRNLFLLGFDKVQYVLLLHVSRIIKDAFARKIIKTMSKHEI